MSENPYESPDAEPRMERSGRRVRLLAYAMISLAVLLAVGSVAGFAFALWTDQATTDCKQAA